jgi:hypothetical protein
MHCSSRFPLPYTRRKKKKGGGRNGRQKWLPYHEAGWKISSGSPSEREGIPLIGVSSRSLKKSMPSELPPAALIPIPTQMCTIEISIKTMPVQNTVLQSAAFFDPSRGYVGFGTGVSFMNIEVITIPKPTTPVVSLRMSIL